MSLANKSESSRGAEAPLLPPVEAPESRGAANSEGVPGSRIMVRLRQVRAIEELGVFTALIVMVVGVSVFHSSFIGIASISNLLQQAASYGIIALGMVFMLSMGDLDLSVGGNTGVTAIFCAVLVRGGMNPWISLILALGVGVGLGVFNALVANLFRLPLIIVTLGSLSMYQGLESVISDGQPVTGGNTSSSFFTALGGNIDHIPVAAVAFVLFAIVLTFVYRKSAFAFAVRAIGSNPSAAQLSGYPVKRIRIYVAGLVGLLCAVTGVLSYAFFQSADSTLGAGLEINVIAAAIIGGTALSGGRGTVPGAVFGALIISVISGALTQFGVSVNWADFVTGAVIIAAVSLDALIKRRQQVDA